MINTIQYRKQFYPRLKPPALRCPDFEITELYFFYRKGYSVSTDRTTNRQDNASVESFHSHSVLQSVVMAGLCFGSDFSFW